MVLIIQTRCRSEIVARRGILHRDISPNNTMFVREKNRSIRCLLIDFDHNSDPDCDGALYRKGEG
ncbi:hypothetical protein H4R18_003353 [Coemansia javaensis]|uniref:Protein kinase domain-containing protein n=1 Tax=Coemansia javaensis TaxID=2761396 RepID=A0A9W8H9C6_9FUNG|nr:hypothetical protein H4R18_003353 [Coemansia javaensis]